MGNLKHIKEIEEELSAFNLTITDLTEEQLQNRDKEIEIEKNGGFVIDGITQIYPSLFYSKAANKDKE